MGTGHRDEKISASGGMNVHGKPAKLRPGPESCTYDHGTTRVAQGLVNLVPLTEVLPF